MPFLIYTLADPNTGEVRYVGLTERSLALRRKEHRRDSKRRLHLPVYQWIATLGRFPDMAILQELPSYEDLKLAERYWESHLRTLGFRLTNKNPGGGGRCGADVSASSTSKRPVVNQLGQRFESVSAAGKAVGAHYQNLRDALGGIQISCKGLVWRYISDFASEADLTVWIEEHIKRPIGSCKTKPPITDETRLKMSLARKGKPQNYPMELRRRNAHKRPIVDSLGNKYESIQEASRQTGARSPDICAVLKGHQKTCKGRVFRYLDPQSLSKNLGA